MNKKRSVGRPKTSAPNPSKVKLFASQGLTREQTAQALGMSLPTLIKLEDENPEIRAAFESGRSEGIAAVTNVLFSKALEGDNACMFFYLKCVAGWRDTARLEVAKEEEPNPEEIAEKIIKRIKK